LTVYGERRKKLLSLAGGKQVVAMTAQNLFYLTDFYGGGAGIVFPDRTVVVTTPLEQERAGEAGNEVEISVAMKRVDIPEVIMKHLGRGPVLVDEAGAMGGKKEVIEDPAPFRQARRVKDRVELERIGRASKGLDRIFGVLEKELKPGKTEWEVAAQVMKVGTEMRLTPSGSDTSLGPVIIASGENGALPHSELTGRRIKRGDFVVADIFFRYQGYNSDATRTFAVGTATSDMRQDYAAVFDAHEAALNLTKTGGVCEKVHWAAIDELRKHGVAEYMNHTLGHGVGIDIHEEPGLRPNNRTRLLTNDVVTDEPGVYKKGRYGIRIEDTLRVDKKPEMLTRFTRDLVTCG
jgi:Xaa-Pro aminopeptidase/Xaa-Pro dipeptidase